MIKTEDVLLRLADEYEAAVRAHGGKSLTRVATLVVSRGSFFEPLRAGKTCTVRNLDALRAYFSAAANWPEARIPDNAVQQLRLLGQLEALTA